MPRILIADDELVMTECMESILKLDESKKYVPLPANCAADALKLISGGVDAAVIDWQMPYDDDGRMVALALEKKGIPYLIQTGTSSYVDAERRWRTLAKPFGSTDLLSVLDAVISRKPRILMAREYKNDGFDRRAVALNMQVTKTSDSQDAKALVRKFPWNLVITDTCALVNTAIDKQVPLLLRDGDFVTVYNNGAANMVAVCNQIEINYLFDDNLKSW